MLLLKGKRWDDGKMRLFFLSLQFWMSAVATAMPIPSGAFMPVFILGEHTPDTFMGFTVARVVWQQI